MLPVSQNWLRLCVRTPRLKRLSTFACWLLGAGALGCFKPDDGREPPLARIYFPTGLALSPDGDRLYVASSDWDLQFNAGSVQVYDAARLRERLPRSCRTDADCAAPAERCDVAPEPGAEGFALAGSYWCVDSQAPDPCRGLGVQSAADRSLEPGLCGALDNRDSELLLASVGVGAFATDLLYRPNPIAGGGRLFVPVRSDATLHWIDVRGGTSPGGPERELECGQPRDGNGECDGDHRRRQGEGRTDVPDEDLPIEPFGIDATTDGRAIVVTHQTEGKISLFTNDWAAERQGPELQYVLSGLPARAVHVSSIPIPEIAERDRAPGAARALDYQPGFWVAFRGAPFVQLVRYFDPVDSPDQRPYLEGAFADRVTTTATSDIRSMAVDSTRRDACEAACADVEACLSQCAGVSIRRTDVSNDRLIVSDAVAVDVGPSRIVVGQILDEQGRPRRRVFLTSFDSRSVTIYDPDTGLIEARVLTGRGPTALAIDASHGLGYVAHFTDSYVGVIDLDRRHATFGTIILALGEPSAPRGDDN
jgi:hypothetical protein